MDESKYLVRPDDKMVFERTEDGLYEIIDPPTDRFGNPPIPFEHFTYDAGWKIIQECITYLIYLNL